MMRHACARDVDPAQLTGCTCAGARHCVHASDPCAFERKAMAACWAVREGEGESEGASTPPPRTVARLYVV